MLRWHDDSSSEEYESSLILRDDDVLAKLRNLPLLKHILIQFTSAFLDDDPNIAVKCWIPLRPFTNLISLELYQFYGLEFDVLAKEIAQALSQSPNLRKLGLGIACNIKAEDLPPEIYIIEHRGTFFEQICFFYESLSPSSKPLDLETLKLGNGVCLLKSKLETEVNYLAKLVKVSGLKTLHICNPLVQFSWNGENQALKIEWSLLEDCISLRQVSVTRITADIVRWLSGPAKNVEELFVTDQYSPDDPDLNLYSQLKLNKLSTLYVTETLWRRIPDASEFPPGASPSTSEGQTSNFPICGGPPVTTILDRLHKNHDLSHLRALSFPLDFKFQWVSFSLH